MSRSLLHDWECAIDRCCRDDNPKEMISIAEDIYNTAYARGKNHSDVTEVLNNIRAEIAELDNKVCQQFLIEDVDKEVHHAYQECLDIIDKYKAESENT